MHDNVTMLPKFKLQMLMKQALTDVSERFKEQTSLIMRHQLPTSS